jgi:Fe-S-cluster containining protein
MRWNELKAFTEPKIIKIGRFVFMPPKNVRWECKLCGRCCKAIRVPLWEEEVKRISEKTGLNPNEFIERSKFSWTGIFLKMDRYGNCIFQKGTKCLIQEFKPLCVVCIR